jgi:hypothetical protein
MRAFVRLLASAFAAGLVANCGPVENQYLTQGIGTDLYTTGLPNSAAIQGAYIAHICYEAGLAQAGYTCDDPSLGRNWATFVQAGLNDIDRRCDSYLAWLDDKKRSQTPILNELHAISATTIGIMRASGVGANPITIVGLAFGLAADTFTNIQSRLVLEANHSTVQAVILDNQSRYRAELVDKVIDNKPAALYLLRGYLRICMPFSIETSMNDTLTVYHRSGAAALTQAPPLLQRPAMLPTAKTLRIAVPPEGPRGPLPGTGKNNPPLPRSEATMVGATDAENDIPQSVGETIQKNLCITSPKTNFELARDAIQQAKIGANQGRIHLFNNIQDRITNAAEAQIFFNATSPPCPLDGGHQTAYEKFRFPDEPAVTSLQEILKVCDQRLNASGKLDSATRDAIEVAKGKINQSRRAGVTDLATRTLRDKSFAAIQATCR